MNYDPNFLGRISKESNENSQEPHIAKVKIKNPNPHNNYDVANTIAPRVSTINNSYLTIFLYFTNDINMSRYIL